VHEAQQYIAEGYPLGGGPRPGENVSIESITTAISYDFFFGGGRTVDRECQAWKRPFANGPERLARLAAGRSHSSSPFSPMISSGFLYSVQLIN
jgi:hypothetical protein